MSGYPYEISELAEALRSAVAAEGWSTDMIIDFESHARGEARPESDYDLHAYVHREGCFYLFEEYARRLKGPDDDLRAWHRALRDHFKGFQELESDSEAAGRECVRRHSGGLPVNLLCVFDTRHVLFSLARETWPLFNIAGGVPLGRSDAYHAIVGFLASERPFHRRTVDVHLHQCDLALEGATACLRGGSRPQEKLSRQRGEWLSSMMTYLRGLVGLYALLTEGWFVTQKKEVTDFVERRMPAGQALMQLIYRTKCETPVRNQFLASGLAYEQLESLNVAELHHRCEQFGEELRGAIGREAAGLGDDESDWLPGNLAAFGKLPLHQRLVGRKEDGGA
jgi:hypothetical protein